MKLVVIINNYKLTFVFSTIILIFSLFVSCKVNEGDMSQDIENSTLIKIDPDRIANVNNGEKVDFSQYENVWEGTVEDSLFVPNGIVNISWTTDNQSYFFVDSDKEEKWRYTALLSTPYFIFMNHTQDNHETYAGTFSLKKQGDIFYITIITNKKCNSTGDGWDNIEEKKETHQYIVGNSKLVFLN